MVHMWTDILKNQSEMGFQAMYRDCESCNPQWEKTCAGYPRLRGSPGQNRNFNFSVLHKTILKSSGVLNSYVDGHIKVVEMIKEINANLVQL